MKRCSLCGRSRRLSSFYRHSGSPDGLQNYCKACTFIKAAEWRRKNPERHRMNGWRSRMRRQPLVTQVRTESELLAALATGKPFYAEAR